MQDVFKVLSDVFLYLEMGDNTVLHQVFLIHLGTTNFLKYCSKCQYIKYHNWYEYTKKCEAKKGVNVAKYSPITFC